MKPSVVVVLALSILVPTAAGQDALVLTFEGTVAELDSVPALASELGTTGWVLPHVGLARDPLDPSGNYVAVARIAPLADVVSLVQIDGSTGAGSPIGPLGSALQILPTGLAFDGLGVLHAVGSFNNGLPNPPFLYRIDPATSEDVELAPLAFAGSGAQPSLSGLAWSTGRLLSWDACAGLVEIDAQTGLVRPVAVGSAAMSGLHSSGSGGVDVRDLAVDASGALHGVGPDGLWRIDAATGEAALAGDPFSDPADVGTGLEFLPCDGLRLGPVLSDGSVQPAEAGERARLAFSCASPGATIVLYIGMAPGNSRLPCGQRLGIASPQILSVSKAGADGAGAASMLPLPAALAGETIRVQAVDPATCDISDVVLATL